MKNVRARRPPAILMGLRIPRVRRGPFQSIAALALRRGLVVWIERVHWHAGRRRTGRRLRGIMVVMTVVMCRSFHGRKYLGSQIRNLHKAHFELYKIFDNSFLELYRMSIVWWLDGLIRIFKNRFCFRSRLFDTPKSQVAIDGHFASRCIGFLILLRATKYLIFLLVRNRCGKLC